MSTASLSLDDENCCCIEVWEGVRKLTIYFPASAIEDILKEHDDVVDDVEPKDLREAMDWLKEKAVKRR